MICFLMLPTLGIYDGHDAGAGLITEDDIYAVNEERLSREKYNRGFPERAIKKVLELSTIDKDDVEKIATAGTYRRKKRLLKLKKGLKKILGENFPEIVTVQHHLAHASGAYHTSGWDKAIVLTVDAAGDGLSSGVYLGERGDLVKIAESSYLDSLGDFYASITEMLGFIPMRHEGKIMALGSYYEGDDLHDFYDCIEAGGLSFKNHLETTGSESVKKLSKKIGFPLNRKDECEDILRSGKKDHELWDIAVKIAASAQTHLEKEVDRLCTNIKEDETIPQEYKEKICFSGGVAQNVKLNKIIRENFDQSYIFPHMGDGGLALGAAFHVHSGVNMRKENWDWKNDLKRIYLGPKFNSDEIEKELKDTKEIDHRPLKEENMIEKINSLLSEGKIIGLFQGRMEYGPRALGNRSIIADPSKERNKEKLNKKLGREPFQPFSPTILKEYEENYLNNPTSKKFMTMSFDVTEEGKRDLKAAKHVDDTCRPQIIEKEDNPYYYKLIKGFEEKTGIGAVLNTSFNLHGDPIVCTPKEAIDTFVKIDLDALVIENYIIYKK